MGVAALAVTISGIMAWQAVTSHRATTALELSRSQVAENAVSWFAHQAETELLRLALKADIALQEQREGPGGPVPDASGPDASGPGLSGGGRDRGSQSQSISVDQLELLIACPRT